MSTPTVTPSEEDLTAAIVAIKAAHPDHGIKKVLADVTSSNPTWSVSEKRVKKLMQARGLVQTSHLVRSGVEDDPSVPVSSLDIGLDVKKFSTAIEARMIDRITGKGLFATRDLKKDEIIFEEPPLAFFAGWSRHEDALSGVACALCTKPLNTGRVGSSLMVRCPHCDIPYCTRVCRQTAYDTFHRLECTHLNPKMRDYLNLCREQNWNAAVAVERCWAHLLLANERGELDAIRAQYEAFATVSQAERQAKETAWIFMEHSTRELWTRTLNLLSAALNPPPAKCGLKKPFPTDLLSLLFTEPSLLDWLGRWNINNQDGGLYRLQSHINHSCSPCVSIDHLVMGSKYKLTVRAIRGIKKGEQLCETYVNPRWNKETRRTALSTNYMFECKCERCEKDEDMSEELRKGLRLLDEK